MGWTNIDDSTYQYDEDGVRFFLVIGKEKALLIDSGMQTRNARELAQEITDLPLGLFNTHADIDHIGSNDEFDEVMMNPAELVNYDKSYSYQNIIPVYDGDVIDLGDRPLRIIDIPGHTPGSIAIIDEKNRILVSGDSVEDGNIFLFGPRRNMDRYIESMKHLLEFTDMFDEIYAMHGSFPVKNDLIEKVIEGAQLIKAGKVEGSHVNIFGKEAVLYKFPYAGFLCDPK